MHIAIAGNIGSGKTTLTKMLAKRYGWKANFEPVDNNPYLADYYKDMERWSFNLQIYFLNKRFHDVVEISRSEQTIVQDRTIFEDARIFAPNLHDIGMMSDRDFKNYIRTNRFFLIAEAALFLIGCMIADMQKPDSYGKYTTIQYYMQIFRGCYPFTDARTEVFQVPLTWFTLMYFCIYTALLYPIRDASGAGIHVLLRAKSRALWWFSKCLALTVWNLLYFAVGFCSVCVFCFFTNGLSCFTILPYDVLPCDALTCLLPFGFALAISLLAFCLCIFCSFVWGQVFAISCLVAVSFTEFPSPFLCYAMLIRCRAMSPAGFDERAGLLFYLIFAGIVCFIGMFLFLQLDLFPGLQRRPQ